MAFALSKLAFILLRPSNLFLILSLIGLAGLWPRPRAWAKALLALSISLTLVVALLPIGDWLMVPLEGRFPHPTTYPGMRGSFCSGVRSDVRLQGYGRASSPAFSGGRCG
jgi:uncharacterized SAM-binding protein YcdF (DUF218 family)